METNWFGTKIIRWYQQYKRSLPWRDTRNAYAIWLSEIILQQTRVAQGMPYYENFLSSYPTIHDLANAPEQDVMRLWQGLGYYSRARNLHKTAQFISQQLNGHFPSSYEGLLGLKGVGPYTAAAIASFGFDVPVAVVDGNVYRVLARVFGIDVDIASNTGQKQFTKLANDLLDNTQPATYNQAIMEFGALQCQPIAPDCLLCPIQPECVAFNSGRVKTLPVKSKKTKVKERFFNYFIIQNQDGIVFKKRIEKDIWQELFDFYLIETHQECINSVDEFDRFTKQLATAGSVSFPEQTFIHILTHQKIYARFWKIELNQAVILPPNYDSVPIVEIEQLPKPILIVNYLKNHYF